MAVEKTVDPLDGLVERLAERLMPILQERMAMEKIDVLDQRRLTIAEAAKYIGMSEECLYIMCREKEIPHYRVGSKHSRKPKILFRVDSLDAWMLEQENMNYQTI